MRIAVEPTVRLAVPEDAERISELAAQLGYPCTANDMRRRLVEIDGNREHAAFVAVDAGMLLGWIDLVVAHSIVADAHAEVAGLVIDEHHRGRGIGRVLMNQAEQWAQHNGCISVRLRSNIVRSRAHAFYERLGYQVTKTQKAFCKFVSSSWTEGKPPSG